MKSQWVVIWEGYLSLQHSPPKILSHLILPSQKVTLSVIPYYFTILSVSQLLFYNTTH